MRCDPTRQFHSQLLKHSCPLPPFMTYPLARIATAKNAGFAAGALARMPTGKQEAWIKRRAQREAKRAVVASHAESFNLPEDFVAESIAKLAAQVQIGSWEAAHATLDQIAKQWEIRQAEKRPLAERSQGSVLALHAVSLGLSQRTVNLIEDTCAGTVGALLECFPEAFADVPNCGPETIKSIAVALYQAQVITDVQAAECLEWWSTESPLPKEHRRELRHPKGTLRTFA
jgi:hypothetical protein